MYCAKWSPRSVPVHVSVQSGTEETAVIVLLSPGRDSCHAYVRKTTVDLRLHFLDKIAALPRGQGKVWEPGGVVGGVLRFLKDQSFAETLLGRDRLDDNVQFWKRVREAGPHGLPFIQEDGDELFKTCEGVMERARVAARVKAFKNAIRFGMSDIPGFSEAFLLDAYREAIAEMVMES